jgi:hypothetical protein
MLRAKTIGVERQTAWITPRRKGAKNSKEKKVKT